MFFFFFLQYFAPMCDAIFSDLLLILCVVDLKKLHRIQETQVT